MTPFAYAVVAAALSGLTVWLALSRPRRWEDTDRPAGPPSRLHRLVRGRPNGLGPRPRALAGLVVAVGVGSGLAGVLGPPGWAVGLGAGLGLGIGLGWLEGRAAKVRRWRLVLDTPQTLELLAAGLLAGLPLRRSVEAVVACSTGPVVEDLGRVLRQIELGVSDVDAWRVLAGHPQLGRVAADLARSVESGTMVAGALELHARDARTERRAALEVRAREVGVRSVLPLMLCFIPSFLLLGVVPTLVSAVLNAFSF